MRGSLRARAACQIAAADQKDARLAAKARGRIEALDREIAGAGGAATTAPSGAGSGDTLADDERVATAAPGGGGGHAEQAPVAQPVAAPADPAASPYAPAVERRPSATWGIRLGFGASTMVEEPEGSNPEATSAVSLGAAFTKWLGSRLAIQFETLLASRGAAATFPLQGGGTVDGTLDFTYLDIVAALRLERGAGRVRAYGLAGIYSGFNTSAEYSANDESIEADNADGIDAGLVFAGGVALGGYHRAFTIEGRYQHGLADVIDGGPIEASASHRAFLFMAGFEL